MILNCIISVFDDFGNPKQQKKNSARVSIIKAGLKRHNREIKTIIITFMF